MLDRDNAVVFRRHRAFARAEHERNARPVNVAIAQPDSSLGLLERDGKIRRDGGFADAALAAGDRNDVFDSFDPRRADTGGTAARRRGLNIDPHLRFTHTSEIAQRVFRFVLDRLRNRRVVRGQRELHDDVAIMRLDTFDQAERNNVAAEARIFHRLKRFLNLVLGDRHFEPGSYRARCRSKD